MDPNILNSMSLFDKIDNQLTDLYFEQNGFMWVNGSECFYKQILCKTERDWAYFAYIVVENIQHKYIGNEKSKSPYRAKIGLNGREYTKYFYLDTITDLELHIDQFIKSLN